MTSLQLRRIIKLFLLVLGFPLVFIFLGLFIRTFYSPGHSKTLGKTQAPSGQVLRYAINQRLETLDPQLATGTEAQQIHIALYEGLVEYGLNNAGPIPAIAEKWELTADASQFTFHLRRDAQWSNGDSITAQDFVYTFRRGLSPQLASRNAYLAYEIKYAQAYNEGSMFVRDPVTQAYLLQKDYYPSDVTASLSTPLPSAALSSTGDKAKESEASFSETPFNQFMRSPERLVIEADEQMRERRFRINPRLKSAIEGKELVPVRDEDVGIEAVDDYTLRITLNHPALYFLTVLPHQFFRVVPRKAIEQYGEQWIKPENIVTSGPFTVKSWDSYEELVVERDPLYWDAPNVKLDEIIFYTFDEDSPLLNMYIAGQIDAMSLFGPRQIIHSIRHLSDYRETPIFFTEFYSINIKKPPMNDVRVRKAFNMAIDKVALAEWRRNTKPLTAFIPEGIFPGYPQPKGTEFNPEKARQLLAEAGYRDADGNFDPKKFPTEDVEITYNPDGSNRMMAEFIQTQWKQNLGVTVPLKGIEFKTFLNARIKANYEGFARAGWYGDYMDPFAFLSLFYSPMGEQSMSTGWTDPQYDRLIDEANGELDSRKRYELLAKAEAYLLDAQPVIPLQTVIGTWLRKPYVQGMDATAFMMFPWKFVYIEPDSDRW